MFCLGYSTAFSPSDSDRETSDLFSINKFHSLSYVSRPISLYVAYHFVVEEESFLTHFLHNDEKDCLSNVLWNNNDI